MINFIHTQHLTIDHKKAAGGNPTAQVKQVQKHYISKFNRGLLPKPTAYYKQQQLDLRGRGVWKSALCPFHEDHKPSLRINTYSGGYRCMSCGTHGGDVLAFHMHRYQLKFIEAAKSLGACGGVK